MRGSSAAAGIALAILAALASDAPRPARAASPAPEASAAGLPDVLVGGRFSYTVQPGDSLWSVSGRFGVEVAPLARANDLDPRALLHVGRILRVENPHLVPERLERGILINVPQRMLFLFREGEVSAAYPVGLGRASWRTPEGHFRVKTRERDKIWFVPPSIQEEQRARGKPVLTQVPPGPDNPLGRYWLGLDRIDCGIHGTIAPTSIYRFQTHGCIRLHPDDIADLYDRVEVGEPVEIVYRPVLLGVMRDGRVLLEVSPDAYHRAGVPMEEVRAEAARRGIEAEVDWARVAEVVRAKESFPRDVRLGATAGEG
jgi:L,D-transpeptidase ErfK/SrfK